MNAAPVTCMVADIVGSSLIMQEDQRYEADLYETFQSLLVPIIEKAVGFGIEFTGDAVSASFRSCKSAVKTGFAIQKALEVWNLSSARPEITVRIGLHSCKPEDEESLQQLSPVTAASLQSLGRADALCVSRNIIDEISQNAPVHAYPMGSHDLGFLPDTVPVFHLFEEKQAFLRRQGFVLEYLKTEYLEKIKTSIISSAVEIPLLITVTLLFALFLNLKPDVVPSNIEFTEVRNLSNGAFNKELSDMVSRIQVNVNSIADRSQLHHDSVLEVDHHVGNESSSNPVSRLVLSVQEDKDQVRLTWSIFQHHASVQTSGGVVTGNNENMAELERRTTKDILAGLGD